ncbi:MAG: 16S rRNA (cytidine(1402)-2'-O)-methyltransferase [Candidatus Spechtbacteria bacterium]|nr:16S rRNA (cytidine(1402)-2'-O)-methyltransferase [Candidatus Spechtbacteria bacterium]
MATLYFVATPIGNLEDISFRALRTFKEVDFILCEDTRVTKNLLDHYSISTPLISYHTHSGLEKNDEILRLLREGKNLALVSDAGTPGISDPGGKLIEFIVEQMPKIVITSIPGPSAVIAAASISGFPMDKFQFLGFPPVKNKRKKFFEEVAESRYPVIFYESRYRILKSLEELKKIDDTLSLVVCRELTKKFETIYRGIITEVIAAFKKDEMRGEFVVVARRKM